MVTEMVILLLLGTLLALIVILGEWSEARFARRHPRGLRIVDPHASVPDPLIPSTVQRSAGAG